MEAQLHWSPLDAQSFDLPIVVATKPVGAVCLSTTGPTKDHFG